MNRPQKPNWKWPPCHTRATVARPSPSRPSRSPARVSVCMTDRDTLEVCHQPSASASIPRPCVRWPSLNRQV
jgi:hypothetical protein